MYKYVDQPIARGQASNDWLLARRTVVSPSRECSRHPSWSAGGLCCGRGKGPSGHTVWIDRTPLSFS